VAKASIHARTLQAAADILGGDRALARYLRVSMPDLFAWMRPGSEPPPTPIFLKAVDLVLNDLAESDEPRAQSVRVAAIRNNWRERT
jgi:hypothetical protein